MAAIPKIFVINMARDVARLESMSAQLNAQNLSFERMEAVDGRMLDAAQKQALYSDVWYRLFHGVSATNGEIGVGLSHRKIYQKMVEEGLEWAIIFEDDIVLLPQFVGQLAEIESVTRDFDMVQLFSFRQPERNVRKAPSGHFEVKSFKSYHASSAAYLLRLNGAQKLLRIGKVRVLSDRWCWLSAMSGLKCCAISPFPVAPDGVLSVTSSVYQVGLESGKLPDSRKAQKLAWRIFVLPCLEMVKIAILRARGL